MIAFLRAALERAIGNYCSHTGEPDANGDCPTCIKIIEEALHNIAASSGAAGQAEPQKGDVIWVRGIFDGPSIYEDEVRVLLHKRDDKYPDKPNHLYFVRRETVTALASAQPASPLCTCRERLGFAECSIHGPYSSQETSAAAPASEQATTPLNSPPSWYKEPRFVDGSWVDAARAPQTEQGEPIEVRRERAKQWAKDYQSRTGEGPGTTFYVLSYLAGYFNHPLSSAKPLEVAILEQFEATARALPSDALRELRELSEKLPHTYVNGPNCGWYDDRNGKVCGEPPDGMHHIRYGPHREIEWMHEFEAERVHDADCPACKMRSQLAALGSGSYHDSAEKAALHSNRLEQGFKSFPEPGCKSCEESASGICTRHNAHGRAELVQLEKRLHGGEISD